MSNDTNKQILLEAIKEYADAIRADDWPMGQYLDRIQSAREKLDHEIDGMFPLTPPAASGQQEAVQALREICEKGAAPHDMEDALERLEADGVEVGVPAALLRKLFAAHPAPAQQESAKPVIPQSFNDWWNADRLTQTNPFEEDSPAYWAYEGWQAAGASAPAPAALTDDIWSLIDAYANARAEYMYSTERHLAKQQRENVDYAKTELERAFATACAAPAEQARDAERYRWLRRTDTRVSVVIDGVDEGLALHLMDEAIDAAIASQQKGGAL